MRYHIEYVPAATKAIERLPRATQRRVLDRIGALATNPRPAGSIKLAGKESHRIRVGDYRIIYSIHDDRLIVLVIDVGHRGDVYRRL